MKFARPILLKSRLVFLVALAFTCAIVWKVFYLQGSQGEQWRSLAQAIQMSYKPIQASRGNIYARDGSLLATSLPLYTFALDPMAPSEALFTQHIGLLSQKLAHLFKSHDAGYYKSRLMQARAKKKRFLSLHPHPITHKQKTAMQSWPIIKQGRYKGGAIFETHYKRYNPFGTLAKRTIGTLRPKNSTGLELAFDGILRGKDGQMVCQKVVGGHWRAIYEQNSLPPIHGSDIVTTLDINLQDITASSLAEMLHQTSAQYGSAIVMEVQTGAIQAMANLSRTPTGAYLEQYNYAIGHQGCVEPGSIFKLFSMLALLEETHWPLNKLVDTGEGKVQFADRWMKDVKKGGHGKLTLQQVFEKSSNVGLAMLVQEVFGSAPEKFIHYIEKLHLDRPLSIGLMGEGSPYLIRPTSKMWNKVTLPWLSIGYNIKMTPLQILTLYNAVANGGNMVKPFLVAAIHHPNGEKESFSPTMIQEAICSPTTLQKLQKMLEGTVHHGLAQRVKYGFYQVAGKTGTAEKLHHGKYTNQHLTSFVGYFPATSPRYSCIIVVDTPQGAQYHFGSEVSAPIFKKIVDAIAGQDLYARPPIPGLSEEALRVKYQLKP